MTIQKLLNNSALRYIFVGGFTFILELLVLAFLIKILRVNTPLAVSIGFWFGLLTSFLLQKIFAFKNTSFKKGVVSQQAIFYIILVIINYIFTVGVVLVSEKFIDVFIARTIALFITTFWNYFAYKYLIFTEKSLSLKLSKGNTLKLLTISLTLLTFFSFGVLFLLGFLGVFVKPGADDFYYLSFGEHDPTFSWYFLNGRITSIVLYGLLYPIPHILKVIPLLTILFISLSFYVFTYSLLKNYTKTKSPHKLSFVLALFLTISSILILPGIYASIYWFAATPVHTWSIASTILLTGTSIILINKSTLKWWQLLLLATGSVIAGCLGEFSAVSLFVIGFLGIALGFIVKNKNIFKTYLALFLSSLVSLLVLFFSPGAISRRERFNPLSREHLYNTPSAIVDNFSIIPQYITNPSILLVIFFIIVAVLLFIPTKKYSKNLPFIILFLAIVGFIGYLIMNYLILWIGLRELQPVRSYFSTSVALILFVSSLAVVTALWIKLNTKKEHLNKLVLFSVVGATTIFIINFAYLPTVYTFAKDITYRYHEWNNREIIFLTELNNNNCTTTIKSLGVPGMWTENDNPDYWVNDSIRLYYGLPCNPVAEPTSYDIYYPPG